MSNQMILEEMTKAQDLFQRKNSSYSNAWEKVGEIFKLIFEGKEIVLRTEADYVIMEVMTRKLEKFIRFLHQTLGGGEDLVNENALETLQDDGIYAFMLLGYLKEEVAKMPEPLPDDYYNLSKEEFMKLQEERIIKEVESEFGVEREDELKELRERKI